MIRKDDGQCNVISKATRHYCIKRRPHAGEHMDYEGKVILDGYIQKYRTGPRYVEQIYFGKAATEMIDAALKSRA